MKTRLLRAGWVVSVFVIGSCGIYAAGPIIASSTRTETTAGNLLLPVGTPRPLFLEKMGPPDEWLSREICVYWNRRTNQPQLRRDCDTLLVEFRDDRVSCLKIVPSAPVRQFVAKREQRASAALVATVTPPPGR